MWFRVVIVREELPDPARPGPGSGRPVSGAHPARRENLRFSVDAAAPRGYRTLSVEVRVPEDHDLTGPRITSSRPRPFRVGAAIASFGFPGRVSRLPSCCSGPAARIGSGATRGPVGFFVVVPSWAKGVRCARRAAAAAAAGQIGLRGAKFRGGPGAQKFLKKSLAFRPVSPNLGSATNFWPRAERFEPSGANRSAFSFLGVITSFSSPRR